MTTLLIGLVIFIGIHLLPAFPGLRQSYIDKIGLLPYKAVFAVISLVGFALILMGKAAAVHFYLAASSVFISCHQTLNVAGFDFDCCRLCSIEY